MSEVITEITPLSRDDCFYLVDRRKQFFDYPVHRHGELELNFIAHCAGCRRIVGDSIETTGDFELVLVGSDLEHTWEQGECRSPEVREITIQFPSDLFSAELLDRSAFRGIKGLIDRSACGIAFGLCAIMGVYERIDHLTREKNPLARVIQLMELLDKLAVEPDCRQLSTSSFAHTAQTTESRRIHTVQEYINTHFASELRLDDIASLASMTPTAFSRFFRLRTGMSLSDYIIDIRLGNAARMLLETSRSITEICYACGFNNISNFNRLFKRKRRYSPTQFRDFYHKKRIIT